MTASPVTSVIQLPDLKAYIPFPLRHHQNGDTVSAASDVWFANGCSDFTDKIRRHLYALKASQWPTYAFIDCDDEHLQVACDFLNILLHLDDVADGMLTKDTKRLADLVMNALWFPHVYLPTRAKGMEPSEEEPDSSKLCRNFWCRFTQDASPNIQERFLEHMELWFIAINAQAKDRETGNIPNMASYVVLRRDSSACKPLFDLLEYTLRIDLPDFVVHDPAIMALNQCVNDFISWSNVRLHCSHYWNFTSNSPAQDILSYGVERAHHDTHNMVAVLMKHEGLNLQCAVDRVGGLCRGTVDTFCEVKANIPSWGTEIDNEVERYVHGLEDWFSSSFHWSVLITERYFGKRGCHVDESGMIEILS